jgi:NADH:ubiquinone reductase (H+-translocating)
MKQITILGAGYAGLRVALDLEQAMRSHAQQVQITLVDQHSYHQIVQVLHLTATAAIHTREAILDFDRLLHNRAIAFVQGRVNRVDATLQQVLLEDDTSLPYDYLVLALGGETDYAGVPGAAEYTMPLRSFPDALRLRDHFEDRFREAASASDPTERRILMTTAIVGGGYTGCQLAGELAAWAPGLAQETGAPKSEARVALLDRSSHLLKQFGEWASREAVSVLDRAGVSVYLNTAVERVEPRKLVVGENRVLKAATIVWAGGIRAPALLAAAGLPTDGRGRALVDRYLRVQGRPNLFALGDCAAIPDGEGATVPATASYATRQGSHLASVLADELQGRTPRPYEPLKLGELVSLGPHTGVGNPLGVPTTGYPVILLKKGVEAYYLATLS